MRAVIISALAGASLLLPLPLPLQACLVTTQASIDTTRHSAGDVWGLTPSSASSLLTTIYWPNYWSRTVWDLKEVDAAGGIWRGHFPQFQSWDDANADWGSQMALSANGGVVSSSSYSWRHGVTTIHWPGATWFNPHQDAYSKRLPGKSWSKPDPSGGESDPANGKEPLPPILDPVPVPEPTSVFAGALLFLAGMCHFMSRFRLGKGRLF